MRAIMDPSFPFAPPRNEREIQAQPEAPAAHQPGVGRELSGVALALAVEEGVEAGALVAARLVIHDPAPAALVDEGAVDHDADPRAAGGPGEPVFVARLALRAEQPAAALVGDRAR